MKWSDIKFNPTRVCCGNLRRRGWCSCWRGPRISGWRADISRRATVLGALVVGLAGLVVPATIRWIYVGCMIAAFPVGWVVSQVMLARGDHTGGTVVPLAGTRFAAPRAGARRRELLDGEMPAGGFAAILPAILAGERTRGFL